MAVRHRGMSLEGLQTLLWVQEAESPLLTPPGGCLQGAGDSTVQPWGVLHPGSSVHPLLVIPIALPHPPPAPTGLAPLSPAGAQGKGIKKKEEREGGKEKLKICLL